MTEPLNVFEVAVEGDDTDPPGYRARAAKIRKTVGGEQLGATVYELDPGNSVCPYHYEGVEEEWLIVLTGTPTLRDPEGEHVLAEGDVVCFLPGPDGAHKVTNNSDTTLRILMLSTQPKGGVSISVYPDSDKVGVWPWPAKRLRMNPGLDYWDGEL